MSGDADGRVVIPPKRSVELDRFVAGENVVSVRDERDPATQLPGMFKIHRELSLSDRIGFLIRARAVFILTDGVSWAFAFNNELVAKLLRSITHHTTPWREILSVGGCTPCRPFDCEFVQASPNDREMLTPVEAVLRMIRILVGLGWQNYYVRMDPAVTRVFTLYNDAFGIPTELRLASCHVLHLATQRPEVELLRLSEILEVPDQRHFQLEEERRKPRYQAAYNSLRREHKQFVALKPTTAPTARFLRRTKTL